MHKNSKELFNVSKLDMTRHEDKLLFEQTLDPFDGLDYGINMGDFDNQSPQKINFELSNR